MKKLYNSLISLRFGIFLTLIMALLSILGSIVPQGDVTLIKNGKLPELLKDLLVLIQANDFYRSPLFISMIALYFVTLSVATYDKIWPIFKAVFRKAKTPAKVTLMKFSINLEIKGADFNQAKNIISKRHFKLINEQDGLLHFEKGKLSKTSSMVAHISLFLILAGVVLSIASSFKSMISLVPGEQATIKHLVDKAEIKGTFVQKDKENWSIKVNKFWMDFHPNGAVKQYYTDISVIDNTTSQELLKKTIFVNEPLIYNGVYFYQTSWGVSHLEVKINGKQQRIMLQPLKNEQGNVSDKVTFGENKYVFFLDKQNKAFIFDLQAQPISELTKDVVSEVNGTKLELKDVVLFTGLQVKDDPGIPTIYTGFIMLIIACFINFFSYSQLWLMENSGKYYLVGRTDRGGYLLEQEINKIADMIEIDKVSLEKDTTQCIV